MMSRSNAVCVLVLIEVVTACGGTSSDPAPVGSSGAAGASQQASGGGAAGARATGGTGANATGGGAGGMNAAGSVGLGTGGMADMSDPGSGTCTQFAPCGGSLVGTWRIDSLCASLPGFFPSSAIPGFANCTNATEGLTASGSIAFLADGTLDNSQVELGATLTIPASCSPTTTSCNALAGTFGSCLQSAAGSCICTTSNQTQSNPETYRASGDQVVLSTLRTSGTTNVQTAYYCVSGTKLLLRGRSGTGAYVYAFTRQ